MIFVPQTTWPRRAGIALAVVASFSLAACDRGNDGRTAGQKVDDTIAKVERKADEIRADAREAARDAKQASANAVQSTGDKSRDGSRTAVVTDSAPDKVKDEVITSNVRSRLAGDPALSAVVVAVDTQAGRVALRGTAPDRASSERAASAARNVDGVVTVDNQLTVTAKP
jgi:osmotically-inducible protein OsmY